MLWSTPWNEPSLPFIPVQVPDKWVNKPLQDSKHRHLNLLSWGSRHSNGKDMACFCARYQFLTHTFHACNEGVVVVCHWVQGGFYASLNNGNFKIKLGSLPHQTEEYKFQPAVYHLQTSLWLWPLCLPLSIIKLLWLHWPAWIIQDDLSTSRSVA